MMYHKINTMFQRNKTTHKIILDKFSEPEFEILYNAKWHITEKIDGMNIRVQYINGNIEFKGRTDRAMLPAQLLAKLQTYFSPSIMKEVFHNDVILYGEGYGDGIQKTNYLKDDQDFILFDVRVGDYWLEEHNITNVAERLNIKRVPLLGVGTLNDVLRLCDGGFESLLNTTEAEGVVCRIPLLTRKGERIITKLKCKDFC